MQPGNTLIDVEVLADQLAEQIVRRLDLLVIEQPLRLLDREQRSLRVLRDPGQHPLALSLQTPLAVRLHSRLRIVELQTVSQRPARLRVGCRDRVDQLAHPKPDQPDGVLRRGRAEHRCRIDNLLKRAVQQTQLPSEPQRVLQRAPSFLCNNNRARYFVNDVGCHPR